MKTRLRERLKKARASMSPGDLRDHSNRLVQFLVTLLQSNRPCTVALYYPHAGEPNLFSLLEMQELEGINWALPVCIQSPQPHLEFSSWVLNAELMLGDYGIPVPAQRVPVRPDLVILPCLGANKEGFRLGYGAGWYDRTLSGLSPRPKTIGVAWADAIVSESFQETHDEPLDFIVTPEEIIRFA